jgi:hypothetical protein
LLNNDFAKKTGGQSNRRALEDGHLDSLNHDLTKKLRTLMRVGEMGFLFLAIIRPLRG